MRLPALPALAVAAAAAALAGPSHAAPAQGAIAPHHAAYLLSLKSSTDQGVIAASGDMTYDVTDACAGLATAQHLSIHMTNRDGQDMTMLSDYATFESKDGTHLSFHTRQAADNAVTAELDGTALLDRSGGRGHADYTTPEHKRVALPAGTLLPNAHTLAILQAGRAGKHFLSAILFDGTSEAGALDSFVTLEPLQPPHAEPWPALSSLFSQRVHVAFFDRDQTSEEPTYEMGMRYFDNGVAADLTMNFGDFVMDGKIARFELNSSPRC